MVLGEKKKPILKEIKINYKTTREPISYIYSANQFVFIFY